MSEYIKRGALIAFVRGVRQRLPKDSKDFFTRDEMLLNFQQYIECQKAADVEPVVRGEWITVPSSDLSTGRAYKCSVCEKMRYGSYLPPYCQCCGAHMERSGSGE